VNSLFPLKGSIGVPTDWTQYTPRCWNVTGGENECECVDPELKTLTESTLLLLLYGKPRNVF
jgi:hypothetical protein